MKRRIFLISTASTVLARPLWANTSPVIQVLKTPTCGCCTAWVEHVRQAGFAVEAENVDQDALYAFKDRLQITPEFAGCHTAIVGDYFIEGHVPASDIERLLAERPSARGLAVPGMPMSSPGMGGPGAGDTFDTLLVGSDGSTSVFASHS
ncbi:DUF411 domain-containing protein [Jannaschia sp. S6380]|uniref:DUF411 domain-containing protein n=1 Tax=Jannaschia sp. S6380 TaxID=2926408 RepID=UPI001FF49914|nr:DUF411 domain-containing protein [Jannaschia sp. S6380]MCK0166690.1 DUF411 domain-containing protein [Jannaschia sp. S6380]